MKTMLLNRWFVWSVQWQTGLQALFHPWDQIFLFLFFYVHAECGTKPSFHLGKILKNWSFYLYSMPLFFFKSFRERERETVLCPRCVCVYVFFHFLRRKEYSAISLLNSLTFHILAYCLILKLSWKNHSNPWWVKPAEKISNVFIISTCQVCLLWNDSPCKWDWLYFKEASCPCLAGLRSRSRPCLSCWFDLHLGIVLLLRKKKKKVIAHTWEAPFIAAALGVFQHFRLTRPWDHLSQWHADPIPSWFSLSS